MTNKDQAPRSEGTVPESEEWVTGSGGPNFTQGGMMPGGDEMENWKKTVPNDGDTGESLHDQAENLKDRVDNN